MELSSGKKIWMSACWLFILAFSGCRDRAHEDNRPLLADDFQEEFALIAVDHRQERAEIIRAGARDAGVSNAVLLAGIANTETSMAHCWSEATWTCEGPASPDCGGGPVIAGSGDGACSAKQGGLCMFQFDSGRHEETLQTYSDKILTVRGCTAAVVPFLVRRAIQSVPDINDESEAVAWMNSIQVETGDPQFEAWIKFVAWRYNGCKDCTSVEDKYRSRTLALVQEFGSAFWQQETPMESQPAEPGESEVCEAMNVTGLGSDFSLKVRSEPMVSGGTNVTARLLEGQGVKTLESKQGSKVIDEVDKTRASVRWIRIEAFLPRGEKVAGWVSALYLSCAG